jgi:hypothetical protein
VVFVLETAEAAMDQRRPLVWMLDSSGIAVPGALREVRVHGPPARPCHGFAGPPITYVEGAHLLELVVGDGGASRPVSDGLVICSW